MSYTNKTTNLELPQYIGTDIPSILTDANGAFAKIDTAYGEQSNKIAESTQNSEQAKSLASAAQAQAQAASNEVSSVSNRVKTLEDSIDAIEETANNANTTANAASTAAGEAKNTADTALSKAATAQSTANTALNNAASANATANSASNALNNAKTGGENLVAWVNVLPYQQISGDAVLSKNVLGGYTRLHYSKAVYPGAAITTIGQIISGTHVYADDASTLESRQIGGGSGTETVNIYPLFSISGDIFNRGANISQVIGNVEIYDQSNHSNHSYNSVYSCYIASEDRTLLGVKNLSTAQNNYIVGSFTVTISE